MTADTTDPKAVVLEEPAKTPSYAVVIQPFVQKLLEKIAKREGFSDGYKIISRPGSNVGDGFMGVMLSIVISGSRNGNEDEELVLVCKIPPTNEMRLKFAVHPFKQEIECYEKLLPALVDFQREMGISDRGGFYAFPKCYGTYENWEKREFAIVLEDLRSRGFRMWNKYTPIDYQHVKLALTELGKFHALSFALRQQRPQLFAQFQTYVSPMKKMMKEMPDSADYHRKNHDRGIDSLHPEDKEEIMKMTHLRDNFETVIQSAVSPADAEPFAVFCHGDFWNNNMMFQYSSADSLEPLSAFFIDWQLGQYCSPATDLSYYIYSSTEQPLRTTRFDDILHDYHNSLADLLQRLGGNADTQFSYEDLHRQLNTFGIYGLVLAPVLIQVVTVKAEDLPDMDTMTLDSMDGFDFMKKGRPDGFNKRMRDVICDFVGRGFYGEKHLMLKATEESKNVIR